MARKKNEEPKEPKVDAFTAVFGNAPVVEKQKAKKKGEKEEVEFPEEFRTFVNLLIVEKAVEEAKKSLEGAYKDIAAEIFADKIRESGKQPEAFVAVNGDCQAQFGYQKPGYGFSDDVVESLEAHGVPFIKEVKSEQLYKINPTLTQEQLVKVAEVLHGAKGLDGVDVIQIQAAETKCTFNDETLAAIVEKVTDREEQNALLRAVASLVVRSAKLSGSDAKNDSTVSAALRNLSDANILKFKKTKE